MPTVLVFQGLDVRIYSNDHRPAHVHVVGRGCEAKFQLNCPNGPVELVENLDFPAGKSARSLPLSLRSWSGSAGNEGGFMDFEEQFRRASRRARDLQTSVPQAVTARSDRRTGRIVIGLSSGLEVGFLPEDAQGLEHAAAADLEKIEITPSGYGIHFPRLDVDLYLPALLQGFYGSEKWMAAQLGKIGGSSRSRAKGAAARKNGKLGGRPRLRHATKVK